MSPEVRAAPRTALVVVSYGSSALLAENFARTASAPGTSAVVVDSWSSADERAAVRALVGRHGWEVVEPDGNVGFGVGANLGVARAVLAGATHVVLLNPDLALDPDDVARLVARTVEDPDALVAPRVLAPSGQPFAASTTDLLLDDGTMRSSTRRPDPSDGRPYVEWLSGACLAFDVTLWQRVGGFAEDYFLYWEDVDLSVRAQEAGARLVVAAEVTAVHDEGGTQGRTGRAKSETYYYFNIRNRLLHAALRLEPADRRRWWRTTPRAVRSVVLQGGRRQLLTSVAPWRATFRGVRDGRRALRAAGTRVAVGPTSERPRAAA
ncbi:glycosyltransferase family 2 protein [Cellulomonas shaoxiangyii]|uniref:Glycosyltransferase family 2 protein n=1 Tax=Cellulomonas shaoxiangyii TaxID=2566013 RepID=A0A4P7SLN5_9CELL|nr:glycosyltransferase family 2 protein [Cellulomonas shaoxiangyii]QCB94437.1 glycosyltransferase family 2 protein [Cellulomonas shaoxiangyii]TGY85158.1 glycosyltransferase family 2 protein [Cellulomonas shaoxiangyii]